MLIIKKVAGQRKPQYNDYQYAIQELKAAGIKFETYAVNADGKRVEIGTAEKGASYIVNVLKRGYAVYYLVFVNGALKAFETDGKKPEKFKKLYVASFGALVKRNGYQWSIGKITGLILSYFEAARLESEANKLLRQQDKKAADSGSE